MTKNKLEKSQLIGFELEIYSQLSVRQVSDRLKELGLLNFEVLRDDSLYDHYNHAGIMMYGVEIRLAYPVKIINIYQVFKDITTIVTDDLIRAEFNDDDSIRGTTGIHIHFGLSTEHAHNILDLMRLLKNVYDNEREIETLAGRPCNRWARSMAPVVQDVFNSINNISIRNKKEMSTFDKLTFISSVLRNSHSDIISTYVNYNSEYQQFKTAARQIIKFITALVRSQTDMGIKDKFEHGIETYLYFSSPGDGNNSITLHSAEENPNNELVPYSDLIDDLTDLESWCSVSNGQPFIYLNKYITNYNIIHNTLEKILTKLNLTNYAYIFNNAIRSFDMDKIRVMYDLNNSHVTRGINKALTLASVIDNINTEFTRLYIPSTVVELDTEWFSDIEGYDYYDNRYFGINATNIGEYTVDGDLKFNTIEFRWASSTISTDYEKLCNYFNFLKDIFFNSFTNEPEMEWRNYTLRDITDISKGRNKSHHQIAVFNTQKRLIGRIVTDRLSKNIKHRRRSSMDLTIGYPNEYNKLQYRLRLAEYERDRQIHKKRIRDAIHSIKRSKSLPEEERRKMTSEIINCSKFRDFNNIYSIKS